MNVKMDQQAAALLKQFQVRSDAPITANVEQALAKAVSAPDQVLTAKQVEQVLLQAMPSEKKVIDDCCKFVAGYHCDGQNSAFLTQILDTRIEKDTAHVWQPPRPVAPRVYRDPYYADMQIDPKADVVMLFNARDVDAKGQPLLMKIVARERADLSKIDLSNYRTAGDKTDVASFDIMKIANNADFIQMKDTDEMEFQHGDPLLAVSLDKGAKEISSTVKVAPKNVENQRFFLRNAQGTADMARPVAGRDRKVEGDQLDRTQVATFSDRIRLEMGVKDTAPDGAWLDTPNMGGHLDVKLKVDHGYMFEPGATGSVSFLATKHDFNVAPDDAQLLGTSEKAADVTVAANQTLRQVLGQNINQRSQSSSTGPHDAANTNTEAWQLIFRDPAKIQIAGASLKPLGDHNLNGASSGAAGVKAHKVPRPGDAEQDGQQVHLSLDKGFLKGLEDQNIKGWKVVAGFVDEKGEWQQSAVQTIRNLKESEAMDFKFDIDDSPKLHQQNKNLEVRVFNNDGVPAERVLLPFREIGWAD